MSPPRPTPNFNPNNLANEEARMRQALGLRGGPSGTAAVPQRREAEQRGRRFVKDGEVPVVVVNSSRDGGDGAAPVNRIAVAEQQARAERHLREQAEKALAEAQNVIQHLRTQLVHAEMAHREALAAERATRDVMEQSLREAIEARTAAEARVQEAAPAAPRPRRGRPPLVRPVLPVDIQADVPAMAEPPATRRRKAAAPPPAVEEEQEPVQWWLPSFRAGKGKR